MNKAEADKLIDSIMDLAKSMVSGDPKPSEPCLLKMDEGATHTNASVLEYICKHDGWGCFTSPGMILIVAELEANGIVSIADDGRVTATFEGFRAYSKRDS